MTTLEPAMSLFLSTSNLLSYHQPECSSLNISDTVEGECLSVLHKLHDQVNGLQLVQVVVQPLAKLFNPTSLTTSTYMMSPDTAQALIARLDTERDVNWLMEIIGYGLSMPFSLTGEQDSVKDCCTIYCEWLASALLPFNEQNDDSKYQQLNKLVPVPIKREPNRYARKMLSHLYNVFLPRQPVTSSSTLTSAKGGSGQKDESDAVLTAISRQAVLCHRVLRTIEGIAHNRTNLMDDETWHRLLALLLTVNDKLLSPPTEPDDIGTQLHDRILGVLFDLILLACTRSIPDSNVWKTFHEMCLNWRHRPALVEHWKRITSLLTKRIVLLPTNSTRSSNSNFAEQTTNQHSLSSLNPIESSVSHMSYENLSQTWYRFLNLIGNPVELSDPSLISRTDEFYHAACVANSVLDPRQHPCLNVLPHIFLNSMSGLKEFIETFIGTYQQVSIATRRFSQADTNQALHLVSQFKFNPDRPRCNSLLHIFGDWLFSAALIGSELCQELEPTSLTLDIDCNNTSGSLTSAASSMTATETETPSHNHSPAFRRKQSHQSTTSSHASTSTGGRRRGSKQLESSGLSPDKITFEPPLTAGSFESGQAEAMAILCKIFASKTSIEDISPVYLARFYLCIQHCLNLGCGGSDLQRQNSSGPVKPQLLASILEHSTALLQKDLDGFNLLIPSFIKAIELVLGGNEKDIPVQQQPSKQHKLGSFKLGSGTNPHQPHETTNYNLRKASITTLVNLLAYPNHFKDLAIRNCLDGTSPTTTFKSLRPKLIKLLFMALQTEADATNMQVLFSGLSLAILNLKFDLKDKGKSCSVARTKSATHCDSSHIPTESIDASFETDTSSRGDPICHSNDEFLIKSLHVTCHLLINIWKHDNVVSLAALEVLTTIARVATIPDLSGTTQLATSLINNNTIEMRLEYMQTSKWICDYICDQCSRPPPAHSRDMHSTIVAAYQCLTVWLYNHPYLLTDDNCVSTLMEVIELGVSGQKSLSAKSSATQTSISREEKLMKPSSMRVREAAEALLNLCVTRTCQEGLKNMALTDTTLDEVQLAELFGKDQHNNDEAYKLFKYYTDENSIVFSLLSDSDSVICLIRTPFGKHCWKFNFKCSNDRARDKFISLSRRTFEQSTRTTVHPTQKRNNESIHSNKEAEPDEDLDRLIASLNDYVKGNTDLITADIQFTGHLDKMRKIFLRHLTAEQSVVSESFIDRRDCREPQASGDIDAARLLGTHLQLKTSLEPATSTFIGHLRALDNQSVRTHDEINIFYVRRNRVSLDEILKSMLERQYLSSDYCEWLMDLGGSKNALVWTDMFQKITFAIPNKFEDIALTDIVIYWLESADDLVDLQLDVLSKPTSVRYFIFPMKNGLFKVDLSISYASPLVNGMILNRSALSCLMRESILNLCRRRRLDADSYQPPHVKRRLLLQELCNSSKITNKHH